MLTCLLIFSLFKWENKEHAMASPQGNDEAESIPYKNSAESLIIRDGFIDTTEDADDLGLKRLFHPCGAEDENKDSSSAPQGSDKDNENPCIKTPSTSTTLVDSNGNSIELPAQSSDNFSLFKS